jgi:hypothetical protein
MRKVVLIIACLLIASVYYVTVGTIGDSIPEAIAKGKTYTGTVYVAGHGGHFAAAEVVIDPSNKGNPIKVKNLDLVRIGTGASHKTHDARIDINDRMKMYWSTYKVDKTPAGKKHGPKTMHVGLSDLKSGKVLIDIPIQVDKRAKWVAPVYCGSGQTKKSFLPVTMTGEAYVDVFDKKTLKHRHRVFLDKLGYKNNYLFMHGVNSPDLKTFAIPINMTSKWPKPSSPGKTTGKIDMVLLDLKALEKGKVKVVAKNTITGNPAKTKTFRGTFTRDGKYLLQSGGDRFYVLDGKTMKLVDEETGVAGDNHDAVPTPDGKYAILTVRTKDGKKVDGALELYDMKKQKLFGKSASVCLACHKKMGLDVTIPKAILCGADVNWDSDLK